MKGSSIFTLRGRNHLLKTMHNVRVTLLCGLLTFIFLRSSLGAGKFGTPVKDYDEIRHHLRSLKLRHQHKLLLGRELADAVARKDASRSTLSLPVLAAEEGYGDGTIIPFDNLDRASMPHNKAERKAHGSDRHMPSSTDDYRPHILLVTGMQAAACESAIEAQFLQKALKNKMDYCRLHGLDIFYDAEATGALGGFSRLGLLRKLMLSHLDVEWIWWMDSVTMFTDMSFHLPFAKYAGYNVIMHGSGDGLRSNQKVSYGDELSVGGSVLLRNCEWSRGYLEKGGWMQGRGVTAEVLVDMDEMKMETYEPGLGLDKAWPFVTDFARCNLCGKDIDLTCLSHMERAFIFADSQHKHVGSL
eukprot:c23129_g1_i1 orf=411-1484(-)